MAKTKAKVKPTRSAGPKPRNDVYTTLLFITFAAIVAGCVMLYLDFEGYGGQTGPSDESLKVKATIPRLGDPNAFVPAPPKPAAPAPTAPTDPAPAPTPAPADPAAPPTPAPPAPAP